MMIFDLPFQILGRYTKPYKIFRTYSTPWWISLIYLPILAFFSLQVSLRIKTIPHLLYLSRKQYKLRLIQTQALKSEPESNVCCDAMCNPTGQVLSYHVNISWTAELQLPQCGLHSCTYSQTTGWHAASENLK